MTSSPPYNEGGLLPHPSFNSYEEIRDRRKIETNRVAKETALMNGAHDRWVLEVTALALHQLQSERGPVPAHFAFFLMGSAGRKEQGVWSDQDHGIIFEGEDPAYLDYFLHLGEEIREGMAIVGYPRCQGKVMASHPRWCKSTKGWNQQIDHWIERDKWESFRHLLTFIDARVLIGDARLLTNAKDHIFSHVSRTPYILKRLAENTSYLQQPTNAFGKLLPEEKGTYAGSIHIKDVGLFPFIHAMRLLAIKEGIHEASTLERMLKTENKYSFVKSKKKHFQALLDLRSAFWEDQQTYDDVHYIKVDRLTKKQKHTLKAALKEGKHLFQQTKKLAESGEGLW